MKVVRIVHTVLGIIPFVWFVTFLLIFTIGAIHLGYIPEYGNAADPDSLNIGLLSGIHFALFLSGSLAFFIWVMLTIVLLIFFRKRISINRSSTILFSIGIIGFLIFKYILTASFLWVFD
jgi:hypothetical protein